MKMSVRSLTCQQSVFKTCTINKHFWEFYPQDGGENQLAQIRNEITSLSPCVLFITTGHRGWSGVRGVGLLEGFKPGVEECASNALSDLGFFRGWWLWEPERGKRASIEGVWAYGRMKSERLSPGIGSMRGTKRHRNNLSYMHNNNMK